MFVWTKKQISFDRRSPEMILAVSFVLTCLFCSPLAAGWHRSCGGSLDNHMISFCSPSGGSSKTNSHNVVNPFLYKVTTYLLRCYKYFTLLGTHNNINFSYRLLKKIIVIKLLSKKSQKWFHFMQERKWETEWRATKLDYKPKDFS